MEISICRTAADFRRFERVGEFLHGRELSFSPAFPGAVSKFLKPGSHFQKQDGTIQAWIASRGGRPVGRVAAIYNRSSNQFLHEQAGHFGFFACENEVATAEALLEKAGEFLVGNHCTVLRGPYNPTIHDDCGMLISGREEPAYISMPWNPHYYAELMRQNGMKEHRILHAYDLNLRVEVPERVQRIARRLAQRSPDVVIRSLRMENLEEELRLAHRLYNETLDRNGGFYPISVEDLLASAAELRAFADPDFLTFCEVKGEPVAFMFTLPNFNEILHRTKCVPRWLRLPAIALMMKTHRIGTVRQAILGLHPSHRDRGIAALLCFDMVERTRRKAHTAQLSWIESNNKEVIGLIEAMGAVLSHRYAIYERPLVG